MDSKALIKTKTKDSEAAIPALMNALEMVTEDQQLVMSPRTEFDRYRKKADRLAMNLIMTLDSVQIAAIRVDFNRHENEEVSLPEFIEIMFSHLRLGELDASPQLLVRALIDMFLIMDLDGDNALKFDEFLVTIVHMGMNATDQLMMAPILPYVPSLVSYCVCLSLFLYLFLFLFL